MELSDYYFGKSTLSNTSVVWASMYSGTYTSISIGTTTVVLPNLVKCLYRFVPGQYNPMLALENLWEVLPPGRLQPPGIAERILITNR